MQPLINPRATEPAPRIPIHAARQRAAQRPRTILLENSATSAATLNRSMLFEGPLQWIEVHALDELPAAFATIDRALAKGLWAAGYLGYECGYHWEPTALRGTLPTTTAIPIAAFGVYTAPIACESATAKPVTGITQLTLPLAEERYTEQFNRIQDRIRAGETYQLNFTTELHASCDQSPDEFFAHMMSTQPVAFGAMLNVDGSHILSASPELFFHQQGRQITVRPMKGSAARGLTAEEDSKRARALATDAKNRAENVMIVDLLRNDLGRIAEFGSVQPTRLFAVEHLPSILQMTSELRATLREDITPYDLFAALFPSGSIVGAPKISSMQLIRALEARDRGIYTGAIGFWSPQGESVFSVAIRTALLHAGQLTMGIGSGIVADSSARAEYNECLLKSAFLRDPNFALIETMRIENNGCALLDLHLDRLCASAAQLHFCCDRAAIQHAIEQYTASLPAAPIRVRLLLSPTGSITFNNAEPITQDTGPVRVRLSPQRIPGHEAELLAHKTTHRSTYDQAITQARGENLADYIFTSNDGHITEGAIHNIFVRHGQEWSTPPLSDGLLPGVYRRHLLAQQPSIREAHITIDDLRSADEIWLTNAVRGIRRAILVD